MAKNIAKLCEEKFRPIVQDLGYELLEVEYAKKVDGMNLTFYIDSEKGVLIEDCERIHKMIDPILDEMNPTEDKSYILNVSSPGLDRPLKVNRDFQRNLNKKIEITLYKKIDGTKVFTGILKAYNNDEVTIQTNTTEMTFNRNQIGNIVPIVEF